MLFKLNLFRAVSVLCLLFSLSVATFADTIRLKDGSIIKGKIVSFGGGKFTILIGDGNRQRQMNFAATDIDSISFDAVSVPVSTVKTSPNVSTSTDKTSTVITVKQNPTNDVPPPVVPKIDPNPNVAVKYPKPIEIGVKVLADNTNNGWTSSGWVVKKGQKIKISGTGRISIGGGRYVTPNGVASLPDKDKLMQQESTGGLIAVIGDNNNDFIFIGESKEFVAQRDGALFLGVNEGNLNDNSGSFEVKVEIDPESNY